MNELVCDYCIGPVALVWHPEKRAYICPICNFTVTEDEIFAQQIYTYEDEGEGC